MSMAADDRLSVHTTQRNKDAQQMADSEFGMKTPQASEPLHPVQRPPTEEPMQAWKALFYVALNATLSASLIAFNKYLMHESRFPYPVPLVAIHTTSSSIFVGFLFLVHKGFSPNDWGWFATLPNALAEMSLKTKMAVLAGLFAVQIVFSNAAYLFSSVVFIQMMKEGNLPLVYVLSVAAALEVVHWQRIQVLLVIVVATLLTIKGELNFTWTGFIIQLIGQSFEATRVVLQAVVLNSRGLNLDVLSYLLLLMPPCATILISCLAFNSYVVSVSAVATPSFSVLLDWWPLLLANTILAISLNFASAHLLKQVSAVGLCLAGLLKDTVIVICGVCFLGESISSEQVVGFCIQITGLFVYSLMKLHPDKFRDGIHSGLKRCIMGKADDAREGLPLPGAEQKLQIYGTA